MEQENASLREGCMKALRQLDLPYPFSLEVFCRQLAERRSRPLHLHPVPNDVVISGICGVWIATTDEDHVFYEAKTSRVHQDHIVLHEIGHMILGHKMLGNGNDHDIGDSVEALLPDLHPRSIQRLFGRTDYTTRQEREAEMLASLIRVRVERLRADQNSEVLTKLESAFGLGSLDVD